MLLRYGSSARPSRVELFGVLPQTVELSLNLSSSQICEGILEVGGWTRDDGADEAGEKRENADPLPECSPGAIDDDEDVTAPRVGNGPGLLTAERNPNESEFEEPFDPTGLIRGASRYRLGISRPIPLWNPFEFEVEY